MTQESSNLTNLRLAAVACTLCLVTLAGMVSAQSDAGAPGATSIPDASTSAAAARDAGHPEDPRAPKLRKLAKQVRDLKAGKLDVTVDPVELFEIPLEDDKAALLEARRLEAIVSNGGEPPTDAGVAEGPDAAPIAIADAGVKAASDAAVEDPYGQLPPEVWQARVDLDRARLEIYLLPRSARMELLETHAKRQKEHAAKVAGASVTEAKKAAQRAAEDQREALDKARRTKSEAVRLVQEERARLLGVKMQLAETDASLLKEGQRIDAVREKGLEWRRRVRELVDRRVNAQASATEADQVFTQLRATLRQRRSELKGALDALTTPSVIPDVGDDPLAAIDIEIDRYDVATLRTELITKSSELKHRETQQRWDLATLLMQEVDALNTDRLALYEHISTDRRRTLTGFDAQGWDQAVAEGHQVQLVARYHALAGTRWVQTVVSGGENRTDAFFLGVKLLQVLALVGFAVWGLRRLGPLLRSWRDGLPVSMLASAPSATTRLYLWLGVMDRIRVPLGWLLVGWVALWVVGADYRDLLEIRLLWTVVSWNLGAILVVNLIDAMVGRRDDDDEVSPVGRLRLATLRLIGRTVVLIGLTLSLSSQLVGHGTIYSWVLTTCWFLAIPLFFVIVSWWRPTIFERMRLTGSSDRLASWVAAREKRWSRFFAAAIGGGYLLSHGGVRLAKAYLSELDVTRRVLAYLFRRELAKQSLLKDDALKLEPLTEAQLLAFDPEARPTELLPTAADRDVADVLAAIDAPGGGVFALVGERGSGKTTLLERIGRSRTDALLLDCPLGGLEPLLSTLRAHHDVKRSDDATLTGAVEARRRGGAVLVDDAQRLVTPAIGGLDGLDRLLSIARASSETCTWVLVFDRALWQFVERSRGSRPLFDDVIRLHPWGEEQIAALVQQRSQHAAVEPTFEDLVATPARDDFMRSEQLARTAAGFYRLLWDYSRGNPAVALQFWGRSLHQDENGRVHVRLFAAPEMGDLEELPDTTAFVLHAIIQLEPIRPQELLALTRIAPRDVLDAIRYSLARGYLERQGERLRVSWQWYRAVTSLLERRHLQED